MSTDYDVVPGFSIADSKKIADQILERKDKNHPHSQKKSSGFVDILENKEPDISASSIFISKVSQ